MVTSLREDASPDDNIEVYDTIQPQHSKKLKLHNSIMKTSRDFESSPLDELMDDHYQE